MGKRKKSEFFESVQSNTYTYMQYYDRLTEIAISAFKWNGLPETVDERFLELALFRDGHCVFFHDNDLAKTGLPDDDSGYLAMRCAYNGFWDVYNVPTKMRAYASNGYNKELTNEDGVIIFNNRLRTNSALDIKMFAKRLYNIDRIIDVNVNAQKTPVLLACPENKLLSIKNVYMQYDGNAPFIFADKSLDPSDLSVLQTDAPFVAQDLQQIKTEIYNECLTYLGISNVNFTKRERLIRDEVTRNQGGTIANRYSRLMARKQACEEIGKIFGVKCDVEYREDFLLTNDVLEADGTGLDDNTIPVEHRTSRRSIDNG